MGAVVTAKTAGKAIDKALGRDYLSQDELINDQWALIFVGSLFWWLASWSPSAFDEAMYGRLALHFQAEAWAMAMMAPAAMVLIGLQNPVKRWMVAVGAALQIVQFVALGYSAIFTGGEPIIGVFCWVFFARKYIRLMWSALCDP
jgi:hypothetical protein